MNRVTSRVWLVGFFLCVLLAGIAFFLWEFTFCSDDWILFQGSPHLYNNGNLGTGTVTDRDGTVLLDIGERRSYAEDADVRKATIHWLGDRSGYIYAPAVASYAVQMAGYDLINGVYNVSGASGTATLTLSAEIQKAALKAMEGRKGTIGIYNYKTGEILCAVTTPTYDPDDVPDISGDTSGAYDGVYVNRFLRSTYIPGSIFKCVTAAAALECVPDILEKTFTCRGVIYYGQEKVSCEKAHGTLDLKSALARSCNCSFAQIAKLIGRENMEKYVARFQITEALEFDGITTAEGNYDIRNTASVSFAWSCIGQYNDQVNPARYMTYMGVIAGGGQAAEPYLVAQVTDGENVTYQAETKTTGQLMSAQTAELMQEFMRNNVTTIYGDGNFPGLAVCAKSGTSQLGGGKKSNAMFSGFIADEQYPLAFIVVVENAGYGAANCVPILSQILPVCVKVLSDG